jgi:hypothetical protein
VDDITFQERGRWMEKMYRKRGEVKYKGEVNKPGSARVSIVMKSTPVLLVLCNIKTLFQYSVQPKRYWAAAIITQAAILCPGGLVGLRSGHEVLSA